MKKTVNKTNDVNQQRLVNYLLSLGYKDPTKCIRKNPELASYDLDTVIKPAVRSLKKHGIKNIRQYFDHWPRCIPLATDKRISSLKLELNKMGISRAARTIDIKPSLLTITDERWKHHINFLKSIGVNKIGVIISRYPGFVLSDIEKTIKPKVNFIRELLGDAKVARVIEIFPTVLGLSLEKKLIHSVEHLTSLGFTKIARLINLVPSLLARDHNKHTDPLFNFLKDTVRIDPVTYLEKFPMTFSYSLHNKTVPTYELINACLSNENSPCITQELFARFLRANVKILAIMHKEKPFLSASQLISLYERLDIESKVKFQKTLSVIYKTESAQSILYLINEVGDDFRVDAIDSAIYDAAVL